MDNAGSIFQLLSKSRIKLNLILTAAKFLAWFAWTGVVTGAIYLMVYLAGWLQVEIGSWLLVSLGGGLTGLGIGWWRRLDNHATARWLDEHLKSREVLSAALVCLERGCSGSFDGLILDAAGSISDKPGQINWPVRYLLKQACFAAGVIILFAVGSLILTPVFQSGPDRAFLKGDGVKKTAGKQSRQDERLVVQSPRILAKMFFPEDAKMAILAERALREGNLPFFQDLLNEAELNMERQLTEMAKPEEQRNLKKEVERRQELMKSLIAASEAENQTDNGFQGDKGAGSSQLATAETGARHKGKSFGQGRGLQNDRSLQNETEEEDNSLFNYLPGGGAKGGTGHNPNKGEWGTVTARTGKEETIISRNKESQVLEYVLPGKNPRLPLTQVIPDSQRSAEAAVYREGIPYEYEEFLRNYFLLLSQETKGAALKEAQK